MDCTKKNIAFVLPSLGMGGAERVASELSSEFIKKGLNVKFFLLDNEEICYNIDKKIQVKFLQFNSKENKIIKNLRRIKKLRRELKQNKIDIVISFITSSDFLTILATRMTNIKVFVSERTDPNKSSKKIKIIRNILYNLADGVVFQTQDAKNYFSKKIQRKGCIIVNPVKKDLPKWEEIKEHNKTIVTACRLEKEKNLEMLINAFNLIKDDNDKYKLVIYGSGTQRDNLIKQIKELKLEKRIELKGRDNQWYKKAIYSSVFVLSSNYEGISNSLLEAMAMGIPVVSTDHPIGGARMLIENGKNGFLVPVNDKIQMANKLKEILENELLQEKFSKEELKVNEKYSSEKIAEEWISYIINGRFK